ncbi:MAG: glycosyltransferase family 1 protein, partial [Nitrososphaeria archaeon]
IKHDFKIVCFGGGLFSAEEIDLMIKLGLSEDQVIQISGDDKTLAHLYRNAAVFVYPSLYEGFGIPLLEAMSLGCPVICSNTSSFPEVAGNAAEFFDPYEADSIAVALENVLYSSEKSKHLVNLGYERVKNFSWEKCADETRSIYLSLC